MTRNQIIEQTSVDMVEGIAAKLHNDGLTVSQYTIEKANNIIDNTCLPSKLKVINEEFSDVVKYYMGKFESQIN